MDQSPSMAQIEFFLRSVFDYLDRRTEFQHRPMANEMRWQGKHAPIVHLVFQDDVVARKPITANYVTLYATGQVFTRDQYVNACVETLQSLPETEIPDVVINYVDGLIDAYGKPEPPELLDDKFTAEPKTDIGEEETTPLEKQITRSTAPHPGSTDGAKSGWQ